MIRNLAISFSLILLLVIGFTRSRLENTEMIEEYHIQVARVIESTPIDFNEWKGQSVFLPQSATNLLRPNALIARQYIHNDKEISGTLMIVHCKDIRDMAGHYPPRCYPANGWLVSEEIPFKHIEIDGKQLKVYGFQRTTGDDQRNITVYSLFALPTGELTTSMREVRKLSADYQYREFGAAQLQVLIDGDYDQQAHQWILEELTSVAQPTLRAVLNSGVEVNEGSTQQQEGDEE